MRIVYRVAAAAPRMIGKLKEMFVDRSPGAPGSCVSLLACNNEGLLMVAALTHTMTQKIDSFSDTLPINASMIIAGFSFDVTKRQ